MEFTNEIFFNKPLTAGCTVIITYCGKLYREHSKDVTIVYGYGDNWEYTDSTPMKETENGFEVTLTIKDYNTFNFCFSNSFNIWDNNSGFNYISPIGPQENNEHKEETSSPAAQDEALENQDQEEAENSNDENNQEDKEGEDIEAAFASLLDSILDDAKVKSETIDVADLSGFGLQSVDNIKEEDISNSDDIFSKLFDELTLDNDNKEEIKAEDAQTTETADEKLVAESEADVDYNQYETEELEKLMDNLIASISTDYAPAEEADATPLQRVEVDGLKDIGLPAVIPEKEDWIDKIINVSYNLTKKFTTACKKFGNLVKLKAQEYGFLNNKDN